MKSLIPLRPLLEIAKEMYETKPVYELTEFEAELRKRYEQTTGEKFDDEQKTGAGRVKWKNMADWVKATHTRNHQTMSIVRGRGKTRQEYRLWMAVIGVVRGERLVTERHVQILISNLLDGLPPFDPDR